MERTHKTILYVEDDADDREFLCEAIKKINPAIEVKFADNGLKAINYLNTVKDTCSELPCLIVLDINMPYLDGRETYKRIKNDGELGNVPIVVFSSSSNPNDKILFNNLGIEFITKPDNISFMQSIANRMVGMCTC